MGRNRRGYIQVDVSDFISEIDDEDLLDEVRDRKLTLGTASGAYEVSVQEEIEDAYRQLVVGRPLEARAILERLVLPKWSSVRAAEADLASFLKLASQNRRDAE